MLGKVHCTLQHIQLKSLKEIIKSMPFWNSSAAGGKTWFFEKCFEGLKFEVWFVNMATEKWLKILQEAKKTAIIQDGKL